MAKGLNSNGYEWVYDPDHPAAMADGMLYIHRRVAFEKYGPAALTSVVHHLDGNHRNNAPENVVLYEDNAAHMREHRGPARMMTCATCGKVVRRGTRERYCSPACSARALWRADWPGDEDLLSAVRMDGYEATGRALGVTGAAVKKRLASRNLLP